MTTTRRRRVLLNLSQACDHLARNEAYLRRLVAQRKIKHYRVGGRLLFDAADLDAYLDGCVVEPLS